MAQPKVKPYYTYKKEANYYLALTVHNLLKKSVALKELLNTQAKISNYEFVITSKGDSVDTIEIRYEIRYKENISLGKIFLTKFESPAFYASDRFQKHQYGLGLTKAESDVISKYAHVLLRPTENRTSLLPNSVVISNSRSVILNYTNVQETSAESIVWTDKGKA